MKTNKFVITLLILLLFTSAVSAGVHTPDFSKRRTMTNVRNSNALFENAGGYSPFGTATSLPTIDMNSSSFNRSSLSIGGTSADLNLKPVSADGRSLISSEISDPATGMGGGVSSSRQGLLGPGRNSEGNPDNDWRVQGPGKNPHEWDFRPGFNPWFSTPLISTQYSPVGDAIVPMLLIALAFAFFKFRKD